MDLKFINFFRRLKWQFVLIASLIVTVYPLVSQALEGSEAKPVVEIPSPRHDAGTHWEGEIVTHGFEVKNTGGGELRILNVKPG